MGRVAVTGLAATASLLVASCGGTSATPSTHSAAGAKEAAKQFVADAIAHKNAKLLKEMTADAKIDATTPGAAFYGDPVDGALGTVLAGDLHYLDTAHVRVNVQNNWAYVGIPMRSLPHSSDSMDQIIQAQVAKDGGMIMRFVYERGRWMFNDAI